MSVTSQATHSSVDGIVSYTVLLLLLLQTTYLTSSTCNNRLSWVSFSFDSAAALMLSRTAMDSTSGVGLCEITITTAHKYYTCIYINSISSTRIRSNYLIMIMMQQVSSVRSPVGVLLHSLIHFGQVRLLLELSLLLRQLPRVGVVCRAALDALHLDGVDLAQEPARFVRPLHNSLLL